MRAWRDMASDMDGFPLCVGVGCASPRDPIQIFYRGIGTVVRLVTRDPIQIFYILFGFTFFRNFVAGSHTPSPPAH